VPTTGRKVGSNHRVPGMQKETVGPTMLIMFLRLSVVSVVIRQ